MSKENSNQKDTSNELYTFLTKVRSLALEGYKEDMSKASKQFKNECIANGKYFQGRQDVWKEIEKIISEHFSSHQGKRNNQSG